MVTKDQKTISHSIPRDNLTLSERIALKELQKMKNIIFKPADKGGGDIWPKQMY